ncbi:MAG TPA: chorismate-binding protein [Candidatus Omnitrophota bacterium]|nr:chorismate-binding protein [Candidatus Omnitrophota bacterium]HRZ14337.1 chorismate-binding protein [Candidatus Omnitrophota bacterium]
MESALKKGFCAAGFLAYEAGYAFENRLCQNKRYAFPLLYLGCYEHPVRSSSVAGDPRDAYSLTDITINTPQEKYRRDIERIRRHIEAGDVYQITYCIKMRFGWAGDAFSLYRALRRTQPVPYAAYLDTEQFKICSLSPEMFMQKSGTVLRTKPMKGTWPRGGNFFSDALAGARLHYDAKNRAENLMITDLLRNDLGRIGTDIRVPGLFEVARYKLLYQMTSSVTARVPVDIPLLRIFSSLFPSGSVTGAPKIRAMQIIRELETEERRIYTGALGYILPDRNMFFNIPIRTLLLHEGCGEMGIGGGIVWDSTAQGEWDEGMLKGRFLKECAR